MNKLKKTSRDSSGGTGRLWRSGPALGGSGGALGSNVGSKVQTNALKGNYYGLQVILKKHEKNISSFSFNADEPKAHQCFRICFARVFSLWEFSGGGSPKCKTRENKL